MITDCLKRGFHHYDVEKEFASELIINAFFLRYLN